MNASIGGKVWKQTGYSFFKQMLGARQDEYVFTRNTHYAKDISFNPHNACEVSILISILWRIED